MKRSSNKTKGNKGFYAALGIIAVMIGSACYFAYDQGNKIVEDYRSGNLVSQIPQVDRKVTNIPKPAVTTAYTAKAAVTAPRSHVQQVTGTVPTQRVQAVPEAEEVMEDVSGETVETAADFDNLIPPLADISNVIAPFSGTELVKNETTGSWQTHNGTDIAAEMGTEVYAVADGEVTSVKNDALWGVTVVIDHHNGFTTKYCSLGADLTVQQGDKVAGGDVIGVIGDTADVESASAPHLHIEMTHNGQFIDPVTALR